MMWDVETVELDVPVPVNVSLSPLSSVVCVCVCGARAGDDDTRVENLLFSGLILFFVN